MENMAYGLSFLCIRGITPHAVKITGGVTRLQPMEAKNMDRLLAKH